MLEPAPVEARQIFYGVNEVDYQVNLAQPRLMGENESYFPGWTGMIDLGGRMQQIEAVDVDGAFRGWNLPVGNCTIKTSFSLPGFKIYIMISAIACFVWLTLIGVSINSNKGKVK
jgi:hypothetical protein